ncbi:unnamed protein product [Candidula unifasciata]|uniref:C-type lectin domain-containing protein n=1 Tax=Candidula unifasciata TaxID=100452 RepID=A0A8S3Z435_9EUPU|nr:unnamed protein product [Candidula unifasciata]
MATASSLLLAVLIYCVLVTQVDSQFCREGWHYFGGSCYGFGESPAAWGAAQAICKVYNGKLAEIETSEENEFLKNLAKGKQADRTLLGGTDIFSEGSWEWSSNGNSLYPLVDWAPGEPNDENCLNFFKDTNYQWNDSPCDQASYFLCETPCSDNPNNTHSFG